MTRQKDIRNNWITFMFVCKYRYNCLRKQSVMNDCEAAFREFEQNGFNFGPIGFGGNHAHFRVDVPKQYSVEVAEIMLKSRSSKSIQTSASGIRAEVSGRDTSIMNQREERILLLLTNISLVKKNIMQCR
ncbi:MAG: transposase [Nanoarchaeota archaeon]